MNSFRSLSFRFKLTAIFSSFAIIAISLCIIGYFVLKESYNLDSETYTKQTVPMGKITNIIENLLIASSSFDMAILEVDEEGAVESYSKKVEILNTQTKTLIQEFEPHTNEEKIKFEQASLIFNQTFLSTSTQIFELLRDDDIDMATDVMSGVDPKIEEMTELFNECRELVEKWSAENRTDHQQYFRTMQAIMLVFGMVILILWVLFSILVPNSMSRPVELITKVANHVSSTGNLEIPKELLVHMDGTLTRGDEFGKTLRAFLEMLKMFKDRAETLIKMADGNLSMDVKLVSSQDTIGVSLKNLLESLNNLFSEIISSKNKTSIVNDSIIDRLNAYIETVTVQASRNAEQTEEAVNLSDAIKNSAHKGSEQMNLMMQAVKEINDAGDSIGKVIKVINDIASQTNILALNAAVEAARTGEHGKGFAVVAEEVRNLAAKSTTAAKDTYNLIANSINKGKTGLSIAAETSNSLQEIVGGIIKNSEIVKGIALSSDNQAKTSDEMSRESQALQKLIERFKIKNT